MIKSGLIQKRSCFSNSILIVFCLILASRRAGTLPPLESKPKSEDILNAIIPPREWIQGGKSNHARAPLVGPKSACAHWNVTANITLSKQGSWIIE